MAKNTRSSNRTRGTYAARLANAPDWYRECVATHGSLRTAVEHWTATLAGASVVLHVPDCEHPLLLCSSSAAYQAAVAAGEAACSPLEVLALLAGYEGLTSRTAREVVRFKRSFPGARVDGVENEAMR